MENFKNSGAENPNPPEPMEPAPGRPPRAPFTTLSQTDADLILARAIQEQERVYSMLRMNEGSDYSSSETGSYEDEYDDEDEVDAMERDLDPANFESDEAYVRAMQEAEERQLASQLMGMAGVNGWRGRDHGDGSGVGQDEWEDMDPDELSYEELVALGEIIGTESKGLSADSVASLPSVNYKAQSAQDGNTDQCVICRSEYEDGESLVVLPCRHAYHPECINKWLKINKVCPVCSAEVSISGNND